MAGGPGRRPRRDLPPCSAHAGARRDQAPRSGSGMGACGAELARPTAVRVCITYWQPVRMQRGEFGMRELVLDRGDVGLIFQGKVGLSISQTESYLHNDSSCCCAMEIGADLGNTCVRAEGARRRALTLLQRVLKHDSSFFCACTSVAVCWRLIGTQAHVVMHTSRHAASSGPFGSITAHLQCAIQNQECKTKKVLGIEMYWLATCPFERFQTQLKHSIVA